jgi:hypothetical protein
LWSRLRLRGGGGLNRGVLTNRPGRPIHVSRVMRHGLIGRTFRQGGRSWWSRRGGATARYRGLLQCTPASCTSGSAIDVVVCPGPFEVGDEFIESLVEAGTPGRVAFKAIDPLHGHLAVVDTAAPHDAPSETPSEAIDGPVDFERVA